jgi:hypothetical protein
MNLSNAKDATLLTADELEAVRRKFTPAMQRRDVLRLIRQFGFSRDKARGMIEGPEAMFQPLKQTHPTEWRRWARETVIQKLNVSLP